MKIDKATLLTQLAADVTENIQLAPNLLAEPVNSLTHPTILYKWNILQVIEHLNTYNNYYLPKIKTAVANGLKDNSNTYKGSILGNYFVKMTQPVDDTITKKYKAAKQHLPEPVNNIGVIESYIETQQALLMNIQLSVDISLTKNKIGISVSPIIKLRLGDVYRFLIAHQQRHFLQIKNLLKYRETVALA